MWVRISDVPACKRIEVVCGEALHCNVPNGINLKF